MRFKTNVWYKASEHHPPPTSSNVSDWCSVDVIVTDGERFAYAYLNVFGGDEDGGLPPTNEWLITPCIDDYHVPFHVEYWLIPGFPPIPE